MGKYVIELTDLAKQHLKFHRKSGQRSVIKKIDKIFKELEFTPFKGEGKPEALTGDLNGFWSRRLNHKDRLVYKVEENIVTIVVVSALGHYDD